MDSSDSRTYWQMVWHHFRRRSLAMFGLWISLVLVVVALLAPVLANDRPLVMRYQGHWYWPLWSQEQGIGWFNWKEIRDQMGPDDFSVWPLVPYSPTEYNLLENLEAPSSRHWFGTDDSGRDVLSRMIYGARISLSVGIVAVGIALVIGMILGALAGYFGGWIDHVISRIIEILLTIPDVFSYHYHHRLSASEHLQHHGGDRTYRLDRSGALCPGRIPQAQAAGFCHGLAGAGSIP